MITSPLIFAILDVIRNRNGQEAIASSTPTSAYAIQPTSGPTETFHALVATKKLQVHSCDATLYQVTNPTLEMLDVQEQWLNLLSWSYFAAIP